MARPCRSECQCARNEEGRDGTARRQVRLPAPVVGRAWQVLKLLEAGHHVARQASPPPPDAAQLGLFVPAPPPPHPLLQELDDLNVDALSPLEALNRLAAWKKQRVEEGA